MDKTAGNRSTGPLEELRTETRLTEMPGDAKAVVLDSNRLQRGSMTRGTRLKPRKEKFTVKLPAWLGIPGAPPSAGQIPQAEAEDSNDLK